MPATSGECEPMSEMLSGAEILCRAFADAGVEVLFGYPGGAIMPFYHALPDLPRLRHILVRHEQAAAHAADGYARASGRVGVCVATSGPGATNLVTGLAAAHMDNSPVVAITGQVSRPMIGRDAFQETDIIGITLPITKKNYLVQDVTELAEVVADARDVAGTRVIQEADAIIGTRFRFDDRGTGNTASFTTQARIVHIDLDRAEIGKNVPAAVGIVGDARDITRRLLAAVEPRRCERWLE